MRSSSRENRVSSKLFEKTTFSAFLRITKRYNTNYNNLVSHLDFHQPKLCDPPRPLLLCVEKFQPRPETPLHRKNLRDHRHALPRPRPFQNHDRTKRRQSFRLRFQENRLPPRRRSRRLQTRQSQRTRRPHSQRSRFRSPPLNGPRVSRRAHTKSAFNLCLILLCVPPRSLRLCGEKKPNRYLPRRDKSPTYA